MNNEQKKEKNTEKKVSNTPELVEILKKLFLADEDKIKRDGPVNSRYATHEEYLNSHEYKEQREKFNKEFLEKVKYEEEKEE